MVLKTEGRARQPLFEQFKENLSLAREFSAAVRDGLRSAQSAWRKATPEKRATWLLVPTAILVSCVAEHFSAPWYHQVGVLVLFVVLFSLGAGIRRAMRHKLP